MALDPGAPFFLEYRRNRGGSGRGPVEPPKPMGLKGPLLPSPAPSRVSSNCDDLGGECEGEDEVGWTRERFEVLPGGSDQLVGNGSLESGYVFHWEKHICFYPSVSLDGCVRGPSVPTL